MKFAGGRHKLICIAFTGLFLAAGMAIFISDADAYQIKRVVRGTYTFASGSEVGILDLTDPNGDLNTSDTLLGGVDLDTAKTMVLMTYSVSDETRNDADTMVMLDDPTTLLFARTGSAATTTIDYMVVEFKSGVTVTSGVSIMNENKTTKDIQLPRNFETDQAIPIIYWRSFRGAVSTDERNLYTAQLTSANNLHLERVEGSGSYNNDISYQIVEFDADQTDSAKQDVYVQKGTARILSGQTSITATPSTAFTKSKSILFTTIAPQATVNGSEIDYAVDGEITNDTTLTFRRVGTGSFYVDVVWHLLSFKDEAYSRHARTTLANGTASGTASTTDTFVSNRSFASFSISGAPTGSTSGLNEINVRGQFSAPSTINWTRAGTASASTLSWGLIELPPLHLTAPNGGELLRVGDIVNITWDYADSVTTGGTCNAGAGPGHKLKIELSMDGGSSWLATAITSDVCANLGTYAWTIPETLGATNVIGNNLKIRITDQDDVTTPLNNYDVSNVAFEIKGTLDLVTPDGGGFWGVGDTNRYITWTHTGQIGNIKILYSDDGGADGYPDPAQLIATVDGTLNSYNWNPVSDIPSTQMRIKIIAVNDSSLVDTSASNFEIRPQITLTAPNTAGEQINRGRNYNVTWTQNGTVGGVYVYLSTNSGVDYTRIDSGGAPGVGTYVGNNGSWTWTVSPTTTISSTCKLKLVMATNSNVLDTSPDAGSGVFSVIASVALTSPVTTDLWKVGLDSNITWTVGGGSGLGNINLKYCTDFSGAKTWQAVPGAQNIAPTPTSFTWNIPAALISNATTGAGNDTGIRIEEVANPSNVYHEVGPFSTKSRIVVSQPVASEVLRVGGTKTIQWSTFGPMGDVYIYLSTSGVLGPFDTKIVGAGDPALAGSTGTYNWTNIPNLTGSTAAIKIYLPSDSDLTTGVADASDQFSIKPEINTVAVDQAVYNIGNTATITWTPVPASLPGTVRIKYDTNSGLGTDGLPGTADDFPNTIKTVNANLGSTTWTIPDADLIGTKDRIRVELVGDEAAVYGDSIDFSIKGTLTLTRPLGTEVPDFVWQVGTTENITWTRMGQNLGNINIKYSKNNGVDGYTNTIATVDSGSSPYPWTIPDNVIDNDKNSQIRIRIEAVADASGINSESSDAFTIKKRFTSLSVPAPILYVGEANSITWNTDGIQPPPNSITVLLNYDTNSGKGADNTADTADDFPFTINSGNEITDNQTYSWTVPDAIGSTVRLRVKSPGFPSDVYNDSADFTIKGKITPVFPTGTDTLVVGNAVTGGVQFQKAGTIGNLKIEFIHNGNSTTITPGPAPGPEGTSNATSFTWTVASLDSAANSVIDVGGTKNSYFKFTSLGTLPVTAQTPNFQIRGELYNISPAGGEVLYIGNDQSITWSSRGEIGNVRIRYDLYGGNGADGTPSTGDEYQGIVQDSLNNNAESVPHTQGGAGFAWRVPDTASTTVKLRIESLDNPASLSNGMATYVASGSNFRIRGTIAVTTPNGVQAPHWRSGQTGKLIDWSSTGTIGNVNIIAKYDTVAGPPYGQTLNIATNTSIKPFPWDIPNNFSSDHVRISITAVGDSTVTDDSNAEFQVKPTLTLTAPQSNSYQWRVGSTQNIVWSAPLGDAPSFKINVSTDGGTTWSDTDPPTLAAKGGLVASTVASGAGQYSWTVPDIMTNEAVIRIAKVGDTADTYDDSNSFFYITGSVTNVHVKNNAGDPSPSTPIDLPIGSSKWITWSYTGSIGNVKIYYATDANLGSPTWVEIDPAVTKPASAGSYNWTIPNAPSPNVKVRVQSEPNVNWQTVQGLSPNDQASVYNSIIGSVALVNPLTGVSDMVVGGSKTIEWTPQGAIALFKVEYKTSAGSSTWTEITPGGGVAGTVSGSNKTWNWTNIPDTITNDAWFRVSDYNDPNRVNSSSTGANIIKGLLDLTGPDGSNFWTLGANNSIAWTKQGSIGNLTIEYTPTGVFTVPADVYTIEANWPSGSNGANTYTWQAGIVGANRIITENGRIRVKNNTSLVGTELTDQSVGVFSIRPAITSISSPAAAAVWNVGEITRQINWIANSGTKADGTAPKVTLEYSTDGSSYTPITGANNLNCVNGANSFTWNTGSGIPDLNSETVTIRISFNDYPSVNLVSGQFSIRPVITVSEPLLNSQLVVGTNYPNLIKWTKTGTTISTVKILYSTDGTNFPDPANLIANNVPVANGTAGEGWNIPSSVAFTSTAKIRVIDTGNSNVYGDSPAFRLKGGLTLTGPTGSATTWTASSNTNSVTWNFTGGIANVRAYYDSNSGKGADNIAGNADDYPVTIGTKALSGNSGSSSLVWDMSATGTNTTGVTNTARVKIVDLADPSNVYSEGLDFSIGAAFDITAPENGAIVYAEDTATDITWTPVAGTGVSAVKLEYTNDSSAPTPTWNLITNAAPNTGSYRWNPIPGALADLNNDNRVRISQFNPLNAVVVDTGTGSPFAIKPVLTVTTPSTGSESWNVGTAYDIKFRKRGAVQSVDIYYSHDGTIPNYVKINSGAIDVSGAPDVNGDYTYSWLIPDTITLTAGFSGKIKVKVVTPATQTSVEGIQSNSIEVKGSVNLGTPSAGSIELQVGATYAITWTKNGAVNNVKLSLSTNGGIAGGGAYNPADDIAVVPSTPSTYNWTVPDKISTNARIRVSDNNNSNVWDESDNVFRIKGALVLTEPENAGLSYAVGSTQTIRWTSTGTFSPLELHYATDGNFGGANVFPVAPLSTVNNCTPSSPAITCNGTASFTIPDRITSGAKVRVRGTGGQADVLHVSTNPFKIIGALTLTAPIAGEVWNVGDTTKQVRWTATGTVTNVKIEYKTSAGGSYTTIAANDGSHTSGNNSYTWAAGVADENTETAYIQISDVNYPEVTAISPVFSIRPVVTVTAPIATDQLAVGNNFPNLIKWTRTGTTIAQVKVLYSTDNGSSYPDPANVIADNVPVGNGVAGIGWNIPASATLTNNAKVKVVDKGNGQVMGESAAFKLKGGLSLTGPLAGTTWIASSNTNSVTWNFTGSIANVRAYYDSNSGKGADNIAGNADDYPVTIGTKAQSGSSGSSSLLWDMSATGTNTTGVTNTGRVKIVDLADPTNVYFEGTDFSIGAAFDITAPENGAIVYAEDTATDITWTPVAGTGVSAVKLEYTNDSSAPTPTWNLITNAAPNTGSYRWNPIPGALADLNNDNRVRISQFNPLNNSVVDTGTGSPFAIKPVLTVTTPSTGSESWNVGTAYAIKFRKRGAVQSVDVYYSYDGTIPNYVKINATPVDVSGAPDVNGDYTYSWLIADTTTLTAGFSGKIKVKVVTPATQTSVEGVQSNSIEVKGSVNLTAPTAAGVVLQVGDTYNVTWTKNGAVNNVKLSLSVNGGIAGGGTYLPANDIIVVPSTPSTYTWTVPDKIGSSVRIRVSDNNNANVWDESDNVFRIKGRIQLDQPDLTGISWTVGTTRQILWTPTGTYPNVEIHYATDGNFAGPNVFPILPQSTVLNSASGVQGSADWVIPDQIGPNTRIRVRDAGNTDVEDISANTFNIVGVLDVTAPESGQVWYVGDTNRVITWDATGTITNVKIEYKTSLAGAYNTIVNNDGGHVAGANTYTWAAGVADEKSETVYIRVSDVNVPSVANVSAAPFSIRPRLTVTSPAAGQRVAVASNNAGLVKWTMVGTKTTLLDVLYDTNDGRGADNIAGNADDYAGTIATNVDATTGAVGVDWNNVPDSIANNVRIKIVDPANTNVFAVSSAFKITGSVSMVQPVGGEVLKVGQNYLVRWAKTGSFNDVSIWYSTDGGTNFNYQIVSQTPAANLQYLWTNIADTPSNNVVVRVADFTDPQTVAYSAPLYIQSILDLTGPENGEVLAVGGTYDITWDTTGTTTNVRLEYATNGGGAGGNWVVIPGAANLVNTSPGSFTWTIPDAISSTVKVRVVDLADTTNWNESQNTFKIRANLTVTSPNGNADPQLAEQWVVGNIHKIRWNLTGTMSTVKFQYSVDGGAYNQIPGATGIDATTGAVGWDWTVPDNISSQVRVRVVNEADSTVFDSSDNNFTILGQLNFNPALPPAGDTIWTVNQVKNIVWTKVGTIPNTKLEYTKDGTNYIAIPGAGNMAGLSFNWTVPDDIAGTVSLRLSNVDNTKPTTPALSGNFAIKGSLTVDTPLLNELWQVDNDYDVKWTPNGTMTTVKIEYSTNGFADETQTFPVLGPLGQSAASLAAGATGVQQTFTWRIPNNISSNVKVRVMSNQDNTVFGLSPAMKIVGGFKVLTPNGGAFYEVDGTTAITWERHGSITDAKLEYSTNGFTNELETFLITTVPASNLSYTWTIPDKIGTNVKVRISDPAVGAFTISDVSDTAFEIRGKIDINAPLGGEVWLIDSIQTISWTKHGTMPSVKVEYSINGGPYNYVLDSLGNQASSVAGTTFSWKIPDQKTLNGARVKITNLSNPTNVFTISPTFTIRGGFSWTNPNVAGTVFNVGSTPTLTWTTFGTINNVTLEYSINNGFSYNPVLDAGNNPATAIPNNGTFNWPIPNNISKTVLIKISDPADVDANDTTPVIKIAGVLSVTQPSGGERWGVGTTQQIQWGMVGSIANVKLEYSLDGGTNWVVPAIDDSELGSLGQKNWLIPNNTSPNVVVRVSDVITDSGTTPVISPLFKIVGSMLVSSPVGTDVWPVTNGEIANSTRNIVWATQGVIPAVNIRYSPTGAAPWILINGTPIVDNGNGGTYAWTVPDSISTTVRIRLEDSADSDTYNESALFTIRGDLNITAPVGGEFWKVGSTQAITWQRNGSISEVYISYSKTGPAGPWIPIPNPQTGLFNIPNTGSLTWTVPDSISQQCRVKIDQVSGPAVTTVSPANFKIMANLDVTYPDGGEILTAGDPYTITWNRQGTGVNNVRIEMATNGNNNPPTYSTVISLSAPNSGSYVNWIAPVDSVSPTCRIRIYDVNDPDSADSSAFNFAIRASFVMDPTIGSTAIKIGDQYHITWTRRGNIPNVKLQYSPDNFFSDIRNIEPTPDGIVPNVDTVTNDPTKGRYIWTVPDLDNDKRFPVYLRVMDPNDPGAFHVSNQFEVEPRFTVTAPNGDPNPALTQQLKVGVPYTITWNSSSANAANKTPNVRILYSTNGGATFPNAIAVTANDGSFDWITGNGGVPDTISAQVKIRIENATDSTAFDESDNDLKIVSNFTLTAPNGGSVYDVGDPLPITWTNLGTVGNVQIVYSTAGSDFSSPTTITNSVGNSGTYAWTVPNSIGYNVRVRVKSTTDDGSDISDSNFRIRGKIAVTAPANAQPVAIGQPFSITWTQNGTIPNVNIYYDVNDGRGADNIAGNGDDYPYTIALNAPGCTPAGAALTCNASYNWAAVPDTATANGRVKIVDARTVPDNSDVIGISPRFNIVGFFQMVEPNGGESWIVGTPHTIRWRWGGTIPVVKLYYTKQTGAPNTVTWTEIDPLVVKNNPGNGNNGNDIQTYNWSVVDDISTNVRVKVEDPNDSSVYDVSDNVFAIRGAFTITAPNGNANVNLTERWVTYEDRQIQWTTNGTMPLVKLEYSNDNFVSDVNLIADNVANTGSYTWNIPDAVLKDGNGRYTNYNLVKVRVSNSVDAATNDISDNTFKIDYYMITWDIRDLLTNQALSLLSVVMAKATDPNFIQWQEAGITTSPARVQPTPGGSWVATWSKAGYGDAAQVVTSDQDRTYNLFMETSAVHIWLADSRTAYNPTTKVVDVQAWLSRDGSIVVGGGVSAQYKVFQGATLLGTWPMTKLLDGLGADTGYFSLQIPDAQIAGGWQPGVTYISQCDITGAAGGVFKTPNSFEITTPTKLQEVQDTVNTMLDKPLSQVESAIRVDMTNQLTNQTNTVTGILNNQTTTVTNLLNTQTNIITTKLNENNALILQATEDMKELLDSGVQELVKTNKKFAGRVLVQDTFLIGEKLIVRFSGLAGLGSKMFPPTMTISTTDFTTRSTKMVVEGWVMPESTVQPGMYEYIVDKISAKQFPPGAYTVLVEAGEDLETKNISVGGFQIASMSAESAIGLSSKAAQATDMASKILAEVEGLRAQFDGGGGISSMLGQMMTKIDKLPTTLASSNDVKGDQMLATLDQVASDVKRIVGDQGMNFDSLIEKSLAKSATIRDIRNRTEEVKAYAQVAAQILKEQNPEGGKAFVQTYYQHGSVKLKVIAVNPSESELQTLPIRIYLPQEAKPEHIIDKGEMEVGFDHEKSLYFVYKDGVELKPKETRVFEVHLKDIWMISEEQVNFLKSRTDNLMKKLEKSDQLAFATVLRDAIFSRLNEILITQADDSVSREEHIGIYRFNLKTLAAVKEDIATLEKLLMTLSANPDLMEQTLVEGQKPKWSNTWKLILAIIIFVGLLGFLFYLRWVVISKQPKPEDMIAKSGGAEAQGNFTSQILQHVVEDEDEKAKKEER